MQRAKVVPDSAVGCWLELVLAIDRGGFRFTIEWIILSFADFISKWGKAMKMGTLLLALAVAGACVGGIVWIAGGVDQVKINSRKPSPSDEGLEISKTGPWPKAVVPETEYEFKAMAIGTEESHKFIIKNEGKAPLRLKKGETTCKCTLSDLAKDSIPIGGEAEVELTWTPKAAGPEFLQEASIHTNDPDNKLIKLTVKGPVHELLMIRPEGGWNVQSLGRKDTQTLTGGIASSILDKFEIQSIEASSEHVKPSYRPMTEAELKEARAKFGYHLSVVFDSKEMNLGQFAEKIVVHTDLEKAKEISFDITGTFLGSIQLLPFVPQGVQNPGLQWYPDLMAINLGTFPAAKGATGWFTMLVGDMPEGEDFQVQKIDSDIKSLTATVTPQESRSKSSHKAFLVTFQVKPGAAPASHLQKQSGKVILKTNHPHAPEIKFYVEYVSTSQD